MAAGVKHDYHLVDPSPWPLVGSIAATVMALGGVTWMKGLFGLPQHTSWLFFAGLAGVLFTMLGWWADVVKEANRGDHTPVVSIGLRYGMVLFIASEVMFFVAWFWIFFEMALFHGNRTLAPIEEVRAARVEIGCLSFKQRHHLGRSARRPGRSGVELTEDVLERDPLIAL